MHKMLLKRAAIISRRVIFAAAVSSTILAAIPANAGGLFGDGGLIKGDVGRFMEKHVQEPIATPVLRGAVEYGSTVGGAAVGGYYGGGAGAVAGGALGNRLGRGVNDSFAGGYGRSR
jgi:hypothetical protein